jgi:SAM-dependent methyltransferase
MKILELYAEHRIAEYFFPNEKVEGRKVFPPLLSDIADNTYDHVLSAHTLQRFSYVDVPAIVRDWVRILKPGGSFVLIVPSLEWCAEQILSESPSPATLPILFGTHADIEKANYCGFTMRALRKLLEDVGLRVNHARTGIFEYGKEQVVEVDQHLVIGKKVGKDGESEEKSVPKKTSRKRHK